MPLKTVVFTLLGPPEGVAGPWGGLWSDITRLEYKTADFHCFPIESTLRPPDFEAISRPQPGGADPG